MENNHHDPHSFEEEKTKGPYDAPMDFLHKHFKLLEENDTPVLFTAQIMDKIKGRQQPFLLRKMPWIMGIVFASLALLALVLPTKNTETLYSFPQENIPLKSINNFNWEQLFFWKDWQLPVVSSTIYISVACFGAYLLVSILSTNLRVEKKK